LLSPIAPEISVACASECPSRHTAAALDSRLGDASITVAGPEMGHGCLIVRLFAYPAIIGL
jgi:hypothetical protein